MDDAPGTLPAAAQAYAAQFFEAARTGNVEAFEPVLKAGLPPILMNESGQSFVMLAAYHGHAALVSLLLSFGANPNAVNDKGQTPLAGAVFKNELEVMRALVEGGADPEFGEPSAVDCLRLFGRSEEKELKELFENAKGKGKGAEEWPDWRTFRREDREAIDRPGR